MKFDKEVYYTYKYKSQASIYGYWSLEFRNSVSAWDIMGELQV